VHRFSIRCWVEPEGYDGKTPLPKVAAGTTGSLVQPIPGKIPADEVAAHFGSFYSLVTGAETTPLPRLDADSATPAPSEVDPNDPDGPGRGIACRSSSGDLADEPPM